MRAYDTQRGLLCGILLPLGLLNIAWWLIQLFLCCELFRFLSWLTTAVDDGPGKGNLFHNSLFDVVGDVQGMNPKDYLRMGVAPSMNWGAGGALGEIIPALLCTTWTLAVVIWVLLA